MTQDINITFEEKDIITIEFNAIDRMTNVLGGDATGSPENNTVEKIRNKTVEAPQVGDDSKVLTYDEDNDKFILAAIGIASGAMPKSVYDIDDDGIVDKSESVDDGKGNSSTAAEVADTVTKKHEHSNKTELDKVTDGDHDVRNDNPHSVTKTQISLGNVPNLDTTNAINNEHTQNTDTKFDEGGANEVSASNLKYKQIEFEIDGSGQEITTGEKAWIRLPFNATIIGWELTADVSGDISIDIWKDTYANFPPTVADTIIGGGTKPNLSSQQKNSSSDLTNWTASLSKGDYLKFNVDSVSTTTKIVLILKLQIN